MAQASAAPPNTTCAASATPSCTSTAPAVPWRYLPHEYPPWQTVSGYFAHWRRDGILTQLSGLLRRSLNPNQTDSTGLTPSW
ncbi:transposase [Streptosporangium subroseum]|uniref:transposase n=1 Tax=Streptosporangium subroseum TaxID=106412 RepID=UPI00341ED3C9